MPQATPATSEDIAVAMPTLAAYDAAGLEANAAPYSADGSTVALYAQSDFSRTLAALTNPTAYRNALNVGAAEIDANQFTALTLRSLGLAGYLSDGQSLSSAVMTANTAALQGYATSGWRTSRLGLLQEGDFFFFNDTITWPGVTGVPVVMPSGGLPVYHPLGAYGDGGLGGLAGGWVWGDDDITKTMWRLRGHNAIIGAASFWGKQVISSGLGTDAAGASYPYADPFAAHANEDRCYGAIRIETTADLGSGKHLFPFGFSGIGFQRAITMYDDPALGSNEELNDQNIFAGRCQFYYSDIGVYIDQLQSFSNIFEYVDGGLCTIPVYVLKGGKTIIKAATLEGGTKHLLYLAGHNTGGGQDFEHIIEYANFDPNNEDGEVLRVQPAASGEYSASPTRINYCRIHEIRAAASDWDDDEPVVFIDRSYATHKYQDFYNAYDGCIHVEGGAEANPPTIECCDWLFADGRHDATKAYRVFDSASDSYVRLKFVGCRHRNGESAGDYFDDFIQRGRIQGGTWTPAS